MGRPGRAERCAGGEGPAPPRPRAPWAGGTGQTPSDAAREDILADFLQLLHLLRVKPGLSGSREVFHQLGQCLVHRQSLRRRGASGRLARQGSGARARPGSSRPTRPLDAGSQPPTGPGRQHQHGLRGGSQGKRGEKTFPPEPCGPGGGRERPGKGVSQPAFPRRAWGAPPANTALGVRGPGRRRREREPLRASGAGPGERPGTPGPGAGPAGAGS